VTATVFLDSNLFIIDRFFRRDDAYAATRRFLARLSDLDGAVPLMTLLELCGAASFRLSPQEADRWIYSFADVYPVRIVDPFGAGDQGSAAWLGAWADDVSRYLGRRMTLGDAILAREADRYGARAIVTWNTRDFAGRTATAAVTPAKFSG
jgi:predicted nucleic acid-binding protein